MKSISNRDTLFEKKIPFLLSKFQNFRIFNYFCANIIKRLK